MKPCSAAVPLPQKRSKEKTLLRCEKARSMEVRPA